MRILNHLFENNRAWAATMLQRDPDFFTRLSQQQRPDYLWIGCSDSRVPANQIVDMLPGEIFVHRNVANVVRDGDLNAMSVLQFAVDILKVRHVIVCGHFGCGGVLAALRGQQLGLVDEWLAPLRQVYERNRAAVDALPTEALRHDRLCALNVIEQAANVCKTHIVSDAWARGQELSVHGWVYGLKDGLLCDLGLCVAGPGEIDGYYAAVRRLWSPAGS